MFFDKLRVFSLDSVTGVRICDGATKAVGGAAGSLSNSGRFEGLSMGMRGFCKGNKKCWLYTDYANDPDKVDADAEFNKYEASAIVTLAGKGIMLNSIEEMQGGAPNTTARYAFIGFLAMSLTINLGAFVYVANYFGKSKGALRSWRRGYASQKDAPTDAQQTEKNVSGNTNSSATSKPGWGDQVASQAKADNPGPSQLKKSENLQAETSKVKPREQAQGEEGEGSMSGKAGPGSVAPPNI
ncbi:hypothetical protein EMMF5_002232 [Cystobasidiomycetes sp. EMM_F5]